MWLGGDVADLHGGERLHRLHPLPPPLHRLRPPLPVIISLKRQWNEHFYRAGHGYGETEDSYQYDFV